MAYLPSEKNLCALATELEVGTMVLFFLNDTVFLSRYWVEVATSVLLGLPGGVESVFCEQARGG